ncbi:MAG: hydantoinase/oxoprolinase family protein [Halapricum sp.]
MTVWLGIDVGGTFTDVALVVDGTLTTAKVPSTEDQSRGVIDGVEVACDRAGITPQRVDRFRHGTTVAVNALLEDDGAQTALVTTDGFADVIEIGRQNRPSLYDLSAEKPDPLVPRERRHTVTERATPDGIEMAVDPDDVRALAEEIDGESVAVSLLHAYAHPENERTVAETLREELDCPVSASHEVLATVREYERTATTVAEAFVTPVIDAYLDRLTERAAEADLPEPRVMQGNGGIADVETVREHAVTTVMSGPAAGVVGAAIPDTEAAGLVTFDMGGTSSDVSLVRDGEIAQTTEADVGGHPVRVPMVDVHTVGAGGGSIAWVDAGGALRVGPRSAGANPGPACYGKGGTDPTVTDADLLLGYLGADTVLGEDLELAVEPARETLAELAAEAGLADARAAARGVYRVANAAMTRAIRTVTVERGHDPREFALVAFGGAGPMHAAALAERLGIGTVLVPRASGVRSAVGLLAADEVHDAVRTHRIPLAEADVETVESVYDDLADRVRADSVDPDRASVARSAACRYAGQRFELDVAVDDPFDPETVAERFEAVHERERGYRLDDEPVEIVTLRTTATTPGERPPVGHDPSGDPRIGTREAVFGDGPEETTIYDPTALATDETVVGPAIFEGGESTVVVPPKWTAGIDDRGTLRMETGMIDEGTRRKEGQR